MILCCNYYYPALQFHATWNFHSDQSFPSVRRSTVAAAQLCHASPTTSCGQGRVKQPEKNMNLPLSDNHNVGWLPKTTSPREKKSLKQTRERECQCEWVVSPLLGWPLTCPDDQLSILSSTQLKVRRKVESANRTQLPIWRIAPLARDSPPFSLSSHRRWAIQAIAGLAADITKLLAAAAAASNHGCSQTADYKRPRGLTAEITARASSQLFRWTSCAAGGGLGATEGARAAGAATLAGSQSWRQPGHWRGRCPAQRKKKLPFRPRWLALHKGEIRYSRAETREKIWRTLHSPSLPPCLLSLSTARAEVGAPPAAVVLAVTIPIIGRPLSNSCRRGHNDCENEQG